jgi:hypothetical protein
MEILFAPVVVAVQHLHLARRARQQQQKHSIAGCTLTLKVAFPNQQTQLRRTFL